ncbi:MAG: hypothetical protein ACLGJA_25085, partial [Gammaproteobacteria bacterium]
MMFEAFDPRSDGQVGEELRRLPVLAQLREALSGKHLLVTGGTGFFGRWLLALVNQLNRGGADIEVTLVSRDPETFLSAMPGYRGCAWLHWQVTDIRRLIFSLERSNRSTDLTVNRFDFITVLLTLSP